MGKNQSIANSSVLLVGLVLLIICLITILVDSTKATTSSCRYPADTTQSDPKRKSVVNVLDYDSSIEDSDTDDETDNDEDDSNEVSSVIPPPNHTLIVIEGDDDENSTLPLVMETPGSSIDTMGVVSEIPGPIRHVIRKLPRTFNNVTGATNKKKKHKAKFIGKKKTHCIACRLNCMNLEVFAACERKYHFYGCKLMAPCITEESATSRDIKTAVGICIHRNGCILKKLKNIFEYKIIRKRNGEKIKKRVRIVPLLPRVHKKVKKLAHNISDE